MTDRKEAVSAVEWGEALQEASTPITWRYTEQFGEYRKTAQEDGESTREEVFRLLQVVTSPRLDPEGEDGPLPGLRSLDDEELADLNILFDGVDDPELRARIADVIWLQCKDYKKAEAAVDAYLQTGERLEGAYANNQPSLIRFERALILALRLGNEDEQEDVIGALESRIRERASSETRWYALKYSDLLYENDFGSPVEQAQLMSTCAENVEQHYETEEVVDSDLDTAKDYHVLAAKWHDRAGDGEAARRARIQGADLLVRKAELAPTQMNAASWYRQALKLYRQIPGTDDRTEEVRELMLDAQSNIRDELVPFSWDPSDADLQEQAREHLQGVSLESGLTRLAWGVSPPSLEDVEDRVKEKAQQNPFRALVPMEEMNEMGHTISKKPGGFEQEEEILAYLMQREMAEVRIRIAVNFIRPARDQIAAEHYIRRSDLVEFSQHSLFVAGGRLHSVSKGLFAGFRENWVTAAHLLAPQIESGLRHLLRQGGVITTGLDSQDIQEQKSLNRMMEEESLRQPLEESLGENVVFDLEGLLNESSGANLRNLVAHGLSDDGTHWSPQVEYMWWMMIRLISFFSVREPEIGDRDGG